MSQAVLPPGSKWTLVIDWPILSLLTDLPICFDERWIPVIAIFVASLTLLCPTLIFLWGSYGDGLNSRQSKLMIKVFLDLISYLSPTWNFIIDVIALRIRVSLHKG